MSKETYKLSKETYQISNETHRKRQMRPITGWRRLADHFPQKSH